LDSWIQRQIEDLPRDQRSVAEAILTRSENPTTLEAALALIHLRAEGATTHLLAALESTSVHVLLESVDDWNTSLILEDTEGTPHLAVFSSQDQAETARQDYGSAAYQSVPVDTVLLCRSIGGTLGLAINPHDDVLSFHLSPTIFAHLRESFEERSTPTVGAYYSVLAGNSGYNIARVDQADLTLTLTWIETNAPTRPRELLDGDYPSEVFEVSPKAFQRWVPLRLYGAIPRARKY